MRESLRLPFLIVAVLLAMSAPLYFARGIGIFDDSLYLKAGQLILDGFKPYRDFYDNKPPGLYYVSAAIAAIGGRGWLAPRIFLFVFAAVFQLGFIRWLQRRFDTGVAAIGAVLFGLSYPLCQGYSLHTEPFGAVAAAAACALLLSDKPWRWLMAGALTGVATSFKQTGALYGAAFALFAVYEAHTSNSWRTLPRNLVVLVAGFLAVLVPIALIFSIEGLGTAMFEAVFTGALNRGAGGLASTESIIVTWIMCPALVAFLGVAVTRLVSPHARQLMDPSARRAFVLFGAVGTLAILPTVKTNLAGHYLQPGAFALSAASALFVSAYRRQALFFRTRLVSAAAVVGLAGYAVALIGGSSLVVREDRLRTDLALQQQLRGTLDSRLDASQPVLCISIDATARLYLMSGRRPFNQSLYFYPSMDHRFSIQDARRALLDGRAVSAVVEIHPWVDRPELNDDELAVLRSTYEIIPVGPQTDHPLLALIRHRRDPVKRT